MLHAFCSPALWGNEMAECVRRTIARVSQAGLSTAASGWRRGRRSWAVVTGKRLAVGFSPIDDRRFYLWWHLFHALTDGQFDDGDIQ